MPHTPGPWEAVGNAVHATNGREIVFGGHNTRSAEDAEKRANARLIAAAPALLAWMHNAIPFVPYTLEGTARALLRELEG